MKQAIRWPLCIVLIFSNVYLTAQQEIQLLKKRGTPCELLTELIKVQKINISFNPADCDDERKVELPSTKMNVEEILSIICKNGGLKFQKLGGQYIISKSNNEPIILEKAVTNAQKQLNIEQNINTRRTETFSLLISKNTNLIPNQQNVSMVPGNTFKKENLDTMKKTNLKSILAGAGLLFCNFASSQSEWGIKAGVNSAAPIWLNEGIGFFGGVNYSISFPWNIKAETSFELFRKNDFAGGGSHISKSYYSSGEKLVITAHEKLEIINSFYGFEIPINLKWHIPVPYMKPYIGAGFFLSCSLSGTSSLHYNDYVNNISLKSSQAILWNKPGNNLWVKNEADKMLFESGARIMNRYDYGWMIVTGFSINKIGIALSYSEGLNNQLYYYSLGKSNLFKLSLNYNFFFKPAKSDTDENSNIQ